MAHESFDGIVGRMAQIFMVLRETSPELSADNLMIELARAAVRMVSHEVDNEELRAKLTRELA